MKKSFKVFQKVAASDWKAIALSPAVVFIMVNQWYAALMETLHHLKARGIMVLSKMYQSVQLMSGI